MKNLSTALKDKTLEDLNAEQVAPVSNLLEPTKGEIESILALLAEGKSYKEVKREVRRFKMKGEEQESAQGFSYGQIKEIDMARLAKVAELTPVVEEVAESL